MFKKKYFFLATLIFLSCLENRNPKLIDKSKYYYPNEEKFQEFIQIVSSNHEIDWMFAKSIIIKESHYADHLVSLSGAVGLMQLMPRNGSYISESFKNYMIARKQKRDKKGQRIYLQKTAEEWGRIYQAELQNIYAMNKSNPETLYKLDKRFDPEWNLKEGIRQLAAEYHFFIKRKHSEYESMILASAAYNAGRFAVMKSEPNPKFDSIPINRETEKYIGSMIRVWEALKKGEGFIPENKSWVLWL
jgi:soluble lytic murein transglycosylase-like protein